MNIPPIQLTAKEEGFGIPAGYWPAIGLMGGLLLVVVINEACMKKSS
jgi:hypothetical protein